MTNKNKYIVTPKPAFNIDTNYYSRMVEQFRTPILQESINNVLAVRRSANFDLAIQTRNSIYKSLDIASLKKVLSSININDVLVDYFKNINVSKNIQDAVKMNLKSMQNNFTTPDTNNSSSANEQVIKMSDMKVESYTTIENYTEVSMYDNTDSNTNDSSENFESTESVKKSPFTLEKSRQRMNEFIFNINETVFKVELQYSLPHFFDGQISFSAIIMIFSIHCLVAMMSKNFDKDKYDEKL